MLKGAAQALDEQRRRNANMRGRVDAQRDADRYAWAFIALHDPPERVERLSADERARIGRVVERIYADPCVSTLTWSQEAIWPRRPGPAGQRGSRVTTRS